VGGGGVGERVEEGEHNANTVYTCIYKWKVIPVESISEMGGKG
jgi:hypothetical protein